MLNSLLLIAQAEAAKPELELTIGETLAAILAMVAFIASFVTVVRCFLRWRNGEVVIPAAQRNPLYVPTAVAVVGVIVAVVLASGATAASLEEMLAPDAQQQQADVEAPPPNEVAVKRAEQNRSAEDLAWSMITGILGMNGVLLFLFGTLVLLTQADGPGRSVPVSNDRRNSAGEISRDAGLISSLDMSFADFVGAAQNRPIRTNTDDVPSSPDDEGDTSSSVIQERWNLLVELKFAGLAFLIALVPTIATRIFVLSLMPEPKSHPFIEMMADGGLTIPLLILLMLIATIAAPIVEELLYRVVVLGGLLNRRSQWVAVGVSSVLFSFAHGFPDSISLLPLAVVLGYTYVQRRSYRTVMLVHLIFNAFNMSLALLGMVGES